MKIVFKKRGNTGQSETKTIMLLNAIEINRQLDGRSLLRAISCSVFSLWCWNFYVTEPVSWQQSETFLCFSTVVAIFNSNLCTSIRYCSWLVYAACWRQQRRRRRQLKIGHCSRYSKRYGVEKAFALSCLYLCRISNVDC